MDLAIFDDGETVGPNDLGLMERFTAYVNAEQDLMQEVDSRMSKGEDLKQIFADIRRRFVSENAEISVTPAAIYQHNLRVYLHELETTEQNMGEEGVRRAVAHHKYNTKPNIHKQVNPPERIEN